MSSLIAPRFELPIVDDKGRITREWYKFLVLMAKSVGPSLTSADDLQDFQNMDSAAVESLALAALKERTQLWLAETDRPQPPDLSLLGFWPGDTI